LVLLVSPVFKVCLDWSVVLALVESLVLRDLKETGVIRELRVLLDWSDPEVPLVPLDLAAQREISVLRALSEQLDRRDRKVSVVTRDHRDSSAFLVETVCVVRVVSPEILAHKVRKVSLASRVSPDKLEPAEIVEDLELLE